MTSLVYKPKEVVETDPLYMRLSDIQAKADKAIAEIKKYKAKLNLIEKNKGFNDYLDSATAANIWLILIVGLVWLFFMTAPWWVIVIVILFTLGGYSAFMDRRYKKQFTHALNENEAILANVNSEFIDVVGNELLPRIHALGMFTVEDLKKKTAARALSDDSIEAILDGEMEQERIEEVVALTSGESLFRSTISLEDHENIEQVVLEVD